MISTMITKEWGHGKDFPGVNTSPKVRVTDTLTTQGSTYTLG